MKKYALLTWILIFFMMAFFLRPCFAQPEDKEIYFWLNKQMGAAYENGQLVRSFRIISGCDRPARSQNGSWHYKPTPKGTYRAINKVFGYSIKYEADMPYAIQFKPGHYIHAWAWDEPLPEPGHPFASHGCISLDLDDAKFLFNWAPIGTIIYIWGERK